MNHDRINYTQVIWEITCLLQEADSLETALRTSLEEVVKAVDAEAGTVWFYNAGGDKRIYPSFWIGGADLTGLSLACGEGIAGGVVAEAKTTVVKDCQSDPRWAGRFDAATGFVTRSMICVPLTNKYETVGCIQIINKRDGSLYTDDDVSLCENLAMLTAIAIDNKGLHLGFTEEKTSVITLQNASKTVIQGKEEITWFRDMNLDILEGEFLVILGEAGSGRAALMQIISGTDRLTDGTFLFEGQDYTLAGDASLTEYRRQTVGCVFSENDLIPVLTVKEHLSLIGERIRKPLDAETVLERVNLSAVKNKYPAQLTDGQKQRVSLAQAIIKNPRIIVADEPISTLPYASGMEVLSLFEDLRHDGITVVLGTHNEEIAKMADRVVRMRGGTVTEISANRHPKSAKELVW